MCRDAKVADLDLYLLAISQSDTETIWIQLLQTEKGDSLLFFMPLVEAFHDQPN